MKLKKKENKLRCIRITSKWNKKRNQEITTEEKEEEEEEESSGRKRIGGELRGTRSQEEQGRGRGGRKYSIPNHFSIH